MKNKHERSYRVTGGGVYSRPVGYSKTHFKNPKKSTTKKARYRRLHESCSLAANRGLSDMHFLEWVQKETGYPESEIMEFMSDFHPVEWSRIRDQRSQTKKA